MGKSACLVYHRVNKGCNDIYGMSVPVKLFEEQMRCLKNNYRIIRFEDEFFNDDDDTVSITFDDGYRDNYLYAFPVLEKLEIPFTVFVTSGYVGKKREFWWDELPNLIMSSNQTVFELEDNDYGYKWELKGEEKKKSMILDIRHLLRLEKSLLRYECWRRQLIRWSGVEEKAREENLALSNDELESLSSSKWVTIGAHTLTHRSLGALDEYEQRLEIEGSKKWLESITGTEVNTFSYPFGSSMDYSEETIYLLKEYGFKKSATMENRAISSSDDAFLIPRISLGNSNASEASKILTQEFAKIE